MYNFSQRTQFSKLPRGYGSKTKPGIVYNLQAHTRYIRR